MKTLGGRIRQHRINCGMSQEELASAIGSTKATISRYERDQREPSFDTLKKIANALNVWYFELLDCEAEMFEGLGSGLISAEDIAEELNMPLDKVKMAIEYYDRGGEIPPELQYSFDHVRQTITRAGGVLAVISASENPIAEHQKRISEKLQLLNATGLEVALERITELTEIPRYKKEG